MALESDVAPSWQERRSLRYLDGNKQNVPQRRTGLKLLPQLVVKGVRRFSRKALCEAKQGQT